MAVEDAVTTAAEFRQYAQECTQSAREAATDAFLNSISNLQDFG
jgi:hypothetical protein